MKNKIHSLKTWPYYFEKILTGEKNFEVRKDDRNFQVGDTLILQEYKPGFGYTDHEIAKEVTYKLSGGEFGIEKGFCVLSIK